ncbi:Type 1 glutamine amidotransferase-like domain-containing protein [Mucilaginibacter boryungensis]|uniref:Type 1 glutamine amidotransferase-like domain-containing protein n=1 Tax=Mucilaginibacter boryungensis TaxID=768480 RepID=A0ABR9XDY0_9SPHI|nr:Type 1 glutamine amidotransferase-like domain-containing protein [Mucilaginibacter boryungensis]MBE9665461.1 Type 1 glutamine amidotransferase-like domain-containing protein [Mucilaginibacter boryungensis]
MKLLLTSSGISNPSIQNALISLLDKPIEESNALFVPTGMYPFPGGPQYVWKAMNGELGSGMCQLGWKSLGLLELTTLPAIQKEVWVKALKETDALLVWGGDPLFLSYWLKESGLAEVISSLDHLVYVGVSAGSIATSKLFGESYSNMPNTIAQPQTLQTLQFDTFESAFVTAEGAGFVDFAIIPHYNNEKHRDACGVNAATWAAMLPVPVYAIGEQTAIKVAGRTIEIVSEGEWKAFNQAT